MSTTFLSFISSSAMIVMSAPVCSTDDFEFLKSKRVAISRAAWLTASSSACFSTLETISKEKSLMHPVLADRGRLHCENAVFDLPRTAKGADMLPVDRRDDAARIAGAHRDLADAVKFFHRARRQGLIDDAFPVDRHREPARLRELEPQVDAVLLRSRSGVRARYERRLRVRHHRGRRRCVQL